MRFKKILLVRQFILEGRNRIAICPPAGLAYLSEALSVNNIEHDVLDMGLGYKVKHLYQKIEDFKPDLLAISMMSFFHQETYNMCVDIKRRYKNLKIVGGGPHISCIGEKVMKDCYAFDYGIVREGEETLLDLVSGVELNKIPGLIYRDDEQIIFNGQRPIQTNLDNIPFPKCEKFELSKYLYPEIGVVSSRGCPYQCIFCSVKMTMGKKFRARSAENFVEELRYWYDRGYRRFNIQDDNFTFKKERVYQICDLIEKYGLKNLMCRCSNGIRADRVDRDLLKRMKEVGFYRVSFGVEAGNDRILKFLKKGEKMEQIDEAVRIACELGMVVELSFLIGSPMETWDDIHDSFRFVKKYPIFGVFFNNIIPFPNTELYEWVKKYGRFLATPSEYLNRASQFVAQPCFETKELSAKERKKAFKQGHRLELQIKCNYIAKQLKPKFGPLGTLIARIVTNPFLVECYWLMKPVRIAGQIIRKWTGL